MNLITIPTGKKLPVLATGSHEVGTGFACIMNALSYLKGDATITDLPDCVWTPLAHVAQGVNDTCCLDSHFPAGPARQARDLKAVICPECSMKLWAAGSRLIGTAERADQGFDATVELCNRILRAGLAYVADRISHDHGLIEACIAYLDGHTKSSDLTAAMDANRAAMHSTIPASDKSASGVQYQSYDEYLASAEYQAWSLTGTLNSELRNFAYNLTTNTRVLDGQRIVETAGLSNILASLTRSIPTGDRIDMLNMLITEFSDVTGHVPIPPTFGEIEQAWDRVNVQADESDDDA